MSYKAGIISGESIGWGDEIVGWGDEIVGWGDEIVGWGDEIVGMSDMGKAMDSPVANGWHQINGVVAGFPPWGTAAAALSELTFMGVREITKAFEAPEVAPHVRAKAKAKGKKHAAKAQAGRTAEEKAQAVAKLAAVYLAAAGNGKDALIAQSMIAGLALMSSPDVKLAERMAKSAHATGHVPLKGEIWSEKIAAEAAQNFDKLQKKALELAKQQGLTAKLKGRGKHLDVKHAARRGKKAAVEVARKVLTKHKTPSSNGVLVFLNGQSVAGRFSRAAGK